MRQLPDEEWLVECEEAREERSLQQLQGLEPRSHAAAKCGSRFARSLGGGGAVLVERGAQGLQVLAEQLADPAGVDAGLAEDRLDHAGKGAALGRSWQTPEVARGRRRWELVLLDRRDDARELCLLRVPHLPSSSCARVWRQLRRVRSRALTGSLHRPVHGARVLEACDAFVLRRSPDPL